MTDSTGEWEVVGRPYTTNGGKNAHVRVQGEPAGRDRDEDVGSVWEGQREAEDRRGGQAMMRLRRASAIATLCLVASAAGSTADQRCHGEPSIATVGDICRAAHWREPKQASRPRQAGDLSRGLYPPPL